jgi:hypothetical protein
VNFACNRHRAVATITTPANGCSAAREDISRTGGDHGWATGVDNNE